MQGLVLCILGNVWQGDVKCWVKSSVQFARFALSLVPLITSHSLREELAKNGGKCHLFRTRKGGGGGKLEVTLLR